MAFNGRAVRLGNTTNFNAGGAGAFPRAIASVNSKLYVLLAGAITEITNIAEGSGTSAVTLTGSAISSNQIGGAFTWNNEIWFTLRGNNDRLVRILNLSTGATTVAVNFSGGEEIGACVSDGTTIWAYATNSNKLYTLRTSAPNIYQPEEVGDVTFESGVTEGGIQGMFLWGGRHYIVGGHNDMLYQLTDLSTNPDTIVATRVDANVTAFGANAQGPAGVCVHNGEVYMVDGARDALFRLLNPPVVQANIPRFAFNEGTEQSLDMTQYIDDLESLAWRTGYTPPVYATIADSGTAIDFADTSSVTQDTDFTLQMVASRGLDTVDVDMPIRVRNVAAMQPDLMPDFGSETITDIVATRDTAITTVTLPAATGGDGTLTYSLSPNLPTGLSFDASTRQLSGTPTALLSQTAFTYTVTDADGDTDTLTFDITVNAPDLMPAFADDASIDDIVAVRDTAITAVTLPAATGGDGTLTYSLSPALPTGFSFNAATRRLSGTSTVVLGQTEYTYTVTDADGDTDTLTFDITVNAPVPVDLMPSFGGATIADIVATQNTAITPVILPPATGGDGTLTYSLSPNLPTGLSFDASTRQLSGTPTALFSQTQFTYTVTDADGDSVRLRFNITVNAPASTLSIESIDEQFITVGTEDYDLVIDISGNPDTAIAKGHMEGFGQDWDSVNGQLHIKSEEVTRLINGVNWDIEVVKDMQTLTGQIAYNVVQAAPIFAALGTIHLYKGVPINFDIIIQNIPPLLIPNAELLGLKSELLDYGVSVKGEISATDNLAFSSGNVSIIVPSDAGGADTTYDYAYEIEDGSPGQIVSPKFTPKGGYGELEFPDVTHALSYEWTLGDGADAVWHTFDSTRQIINPGEVEITPGNLNVTVKFLNVPGASSYEYRLDTEAGEGSWVRFTGTLANGFITTIIPNLEEGVEYTLRLRVASPWVGSPISISVTGGRVCYTIQINTSDRTQQYLYIFSNGFADNALATRIKRLLLPTSLSHPDNGGLAVNSDGDVFVLNMVDGVGNEKAVYVFSANTIEQTADGARLTQDRKHPFPSAAPNSSGRLRSRYFGEYNNEFYAYFILGNAGWHSMLHAFAVPTTDGVALTSDRSTPSIPRGFTGSDDLTGMSLTEENIWYPYFSHPSRGFARIDRGRFTQDVTITRVFTYNRRVSDAINAGGGLKVIGESFYTVRGNVLRLFEKNPELPRTNTVSIVKEITLPSGITAARYLDILT